MTVSFYGSASRFCGFWSSEKSDAVVFKLVASEAERAMPLI